MITECTVHGMILSCSTPAAHGEIATWFKDFGPIICSVASFWLAYRVSRVTREQKEINKSAYNLNLFKERFAVWNDFQAKKDTAIHLKRIFLFDKYTENDDELREFKKNVFEVENILKKIVFLFVNKDTPEKFKSIISHIEYNINTLDNAEEYRRLLKEGNRIKTIYRSYISPENRTYRGMKIYIDDVFSGIKTYRGLYNFVHECHENSDFIKKIFISNHSYESLYWIFDDMYYNTMVEYYELEDKISEFYDSVDEEVLVYDDRSREEVEYHLKEGEKLEKEIEECRKFLESLKETHKGALSDVYALHKEMKEKFMDDEKKCEEILEKTNIDDDRENVRDERFFNSVNDLMQYHLRIDG